MELSATIRDVFGKKLRHYRKEYVPAIVYKAEGEEKNVPIFLSLKQVQSLRGKLGNECITLKIEDDKDRKVVIKDYDLHPVTNIVEHIDFIDISKRETIALNVKLIFTNTEESPGIKYGGVLNIVKKKINVVCKTNDLVKSIEIDLTGKLVGHSIRVKDLILPSNTFGYGIKYDHNDTIATILGKRSSKADSSSVSGETNEVSAS